MISRKFLLFRFFATIAVCIALLVTLFMKDNTVWRTVLLILLIYMDLLNIYCSACPHCGKRFRTGLYFNPFRSNAGFCKHCGNEVTFK